MVSWCPRSHPQVNRASNPEEKVEVKQDSEDKPESVSTG